MLLDGGNEPVHAPSLNLLPNTNVVSIYGTCLMWFVQYGIWEVENVLGRWKAEERLARSLFLKADGCKHFVGT